VLWFVTGIALGVFGFTYFEWQRAWDNFPRPGRLPANVTYLPP
jgi:hypothetical protein